MIVNNLVHRVFPLGEEKRLWSLDLLSKAIQDEVNKYFIFG
jgi:hypothetical protein